MTKCSILATSKNPESECGVCDIGPPLDDRGIRKGGSRLLAHLLDLKLMVDAGCHFALNDLTWDEWEGLKILKMEINLRDKAAQDKQNETNLYTPTHVQPSRRVH